MPILKKFETKTEESLFNNFSSSVINRFFKSVFKSYLYNAWCFVIQLPLHTNKEGLKIYLLRRTSTNLYLIILQIVTNKEGESFFDIFIFT